MKKIEQFIRNNSEHFDDAEPKAGHINRFEELLKREERKVVPIASGKRWMRVAAIALVLVTSGLVGYDLLSGRAFARNDNGLASAVFSADTREALDYYSKETTSQMNEIDRIATDCPGAKDLKGKAEQESAVFDANHEELTRALNENPGNEKMEAALIRNQKLKEVALNNLILQGNMESCGKK